MLWHPCPPHPVALCLPARDRQPMSRISRPVIPLSWFCARAGRLGLEEAARLAKVEWRKSPPAGMVCQDKTANGDWFSGVLQAEGGSKAFDLERSKKTSSDYRAEQVSAKLFGRFWNRIMPVSWDS